MAFTRSSCLQNPSPWRFNVQRAAVLVCFALMVALGAGTITVAAQPTGPGSSMDAASEWLLAQRDSDGAFPGFDGTADAGVTVDAVTALALAGRASELAPSLTWLESEALVYAQTGPGTAAKLAMMLIIAGENPRDFASVDPLSIVEHAAEQGMIGFGPFDHALGLLALTAGGSAIPEAALAAVWDTQGEEGGWAFDGNTAAGAADTNTTALMVRALVAAGHGGDERVAEAAAWLLSLVTADGMPYQPGGPADSNSTALALRALAAYGAARPMAELDVLLEALMAFQNDNGSYSWMLDPRDENMFSTVEAIPALAVMAPVLAVPTAMPDAPPASPVASPVASPEASPVAWQLAA